MVFNKLSSDTLLRKELTLTLGGRRLCHIVDTCKHIHSDLGLSLIADFRKAKGKTVENKTAKKDTVFHPLLQF